MAETCADGDEEAVYRMVNSNLRLVVSIVRKYDTKGIPLMDLIQEGNIGLLKAARKFDYRMECKFSTYASKWIHHYVSRYILNHENLIHIPAHRKEQIRKVMAVKTSLKHQNGLEPTLEQIAAGSGETLEEVQKLLKQVPQVLYSLDAPVNEEEAMAMQLTLEDPDAPQPMEAAAYRDLKQTLENLFEKLTLRQRQVLRLRFGMEDGICYSLQQIGTALGISKERARQVEREAIEKLKKLGADLGLEDFLL